jgi:hypothetical protein
VFVEVISARSTCLLGVDLLKTFNIHGQQGNPVSLLSLKKRWSFMFRAITINSGGGGWGETVCPQVAKGVQWWGILPAAGSFARQWLLCHFRMLHFDIWRTASHVLESSAWADSHKRPCWLLLKKKIGDIWRTQRDPTPYRSWGYAKNEMAWWMSLDIWQPTMYSITSKLSIPCIFIQRLGP